MRGPRRFKADFNAATVDSIRAAVSASLADGDVPLPAAFNLLTVTDEIVCNVLEHSRATWVEVEVHPEPQRVRIIVRDDGPPFDPTEMESIALEAPPLDPSMRKLGIYMMGRLSDLCQYRRVDDAKNELSFEMNTQLS